MGKFSARGFMIVAVADTHSVLWHLFSDVRLSSRAKEFLDQAAVAGNQIAVSSITLAEVVYLTEKGRVASETWDRLVELLDYSPSPVIEIHVDRMICRRLALIPRSAVPDLPDRIIAATALYLDVPVISRDYRIRTSGITTIW
jgi:PIN domain nuclease of toxin-antitoxin system